METKLDQLNHETRVINVITNSTFIDKYKSKYVDSYLTIFNLYNSYQQYIDNKQIITCKGWVLTSRKQSNNWFIQLYDGSSGNNLQILFNLTQDTAELNSISSNLHAGTTIEVSGTIVNSPAKGQLFEMIGNSINILGKINDAATYLPCVKGIKIENLRSKAHLRSKFQSMRAIYRIRNCIIQGIHQFFKLHNFFQLDPNVITTSDCEGAGEVFTITTQFNDVKSKTVDFSKDFFKKQAFLTVSSQLQLEALCAGMSKVYTMNPSFRAEPSQTNRHVACFTHVEWEIAFIDLKQLLNFNEDIISYVIAYVLDNCMDDLLVLDKFVSIGIIDKLKKSIEQPFVRITYTEALNILSSGEHQNALKIKYSDFKMPEWGDDLGSNCERYLSDIVYKKPVLVYNYPKVLKSFYMKQNDTEEIIYSKEYKTVQSCDLLLPGIGEVIGSSIREDDYNKLVSIMNEKNMKSEPLDWYLDLRKNGTFPHGGAGLGMDRLVAYCTFTTDGSIKDVIPFPVAYEMCEY
jgi:asparaginyl-tRNA synthetase